MRTKLSVSPSKINAYLTYLNAIPSDKHDYLVDREGGWKVTLEDLIDQIKGTKVWKVSLNIGSSIHAAIEGDPKLKMFDSQEMLNYYVKDDKDKLALLHSEHEQIIDICEKHIPYYKDIVYEQWLQYEIMDNVWINSRTDGLYLNTVDEFKSSGREKSVKHFEDSIQWKIYLHGTESEKINYHFFIYKQKQKNYVKQRPFELRYKHLEFYRYRGMEKDIKDAVNGFISFCDDNNLMSYIQKKY